MLIPEPTLITSESGFEEVLIKAIHQTLSEAGRNYLVIRHFGLDIATFIESSAGVVVRLVEVKVYSAQRKGGIGFGNQRGEGPQVDLLASSRHQIQLLQPMIRWILADLTLPLGTKRYACFGCAKAKESVMGGVQRSKQNNFKTSALQPIYISWAELISQLTEFLLN